MSPPASVGLDAVFENPLLRGLDTAARGLLRAASRIRALEAGDILFQRGAPADALYVVVRGTIELRGGGEATRTRQVHAGESLGEEASLGLSRRVTAVAAGSTLVAEVPTALFERGIGRSQAGELWERERRTIQRHATRELLLESDLGSGLKRDDLERLLDAARHETYARGDPIFDVGDPVGGLQVVVDGLVGLQPREAIDSVEASAVRAYFRRGDLIDNGDAQAGIRTLRALAMGRTRLIELPRTLVDEVLAAHPSVRETLERRAGERRDVARHALSEAAVHGTRHAFGDLHRMHVARSLLVIDNETCVRCGHCAWSCAKVHGDARLVRRGETLVARLASTNDDKPRTLLVPHACQHCEDPVCMRDCPTGAIERGHQGEVVIEPSLCTGCGNCAKTCPWENIYLVPRAGNDEHGTGSAEVAVKCDLCREYDGPACVRGCPTQAIFRIDPSREIVEVAQVLGRNPTGRRAKARPTFLGVGWVLVSLLVATCVAVIWALRLHAAGHWAPDRDIGWIGGWLALGTLFGLVAHAVLKRCPKLWLKRSRRAKPLVGDNRSFVRPFVHVHVGLGLLGLTAAVVHAGPRLSEGVAGSLYVTWLASCALGLWGALAYRVLAPVLNKLEREGALPEDLGRRTDALVDRFHRELSGRSSVVKRLSERVLLPYVRAPWGPIVLACSGRRLAQERKRLRMRIDAILQGRGADKLQGLDALVRTAVELRALPARRLLHAALRGWLAPHLIATGIVVVLAVVHVFMMVKP